MRKTSGARIPNARMQRTFWDLLICTLYVYSMTVLQDFELFRVFDALEFEDEDTERQEITHHHEAELDSSQTRLMMNFFCI